MQMWETTELEEEKTEIFIKTTQALYSEALSKHEENYVSS